MSTNGSAPAPPHLPAWLAVVAACTGFAAMGSMARASAGLGIRPALVIAEAFLVAPAFAAFALRGIPWRRGLALSPLPILGTLLSLLAGAALWAAGLGLFELQYAAWRPPPGYLDAFELLHRALRPSGPLDAIGSVVAIAVAPAVCEEIVFRGTLLPSFVRFLRPGGALVLSSLLFGLIHVDPTTSGAYTMYRVPFAFVVGLGLGALRLRTGSLVPAMLAHAVLNTITFAAVFVTGPSGELPPADVAKGAALLVGGLAASGVLLRAFQRRADAH